jgi:hypothetical protein
METQERTLEQVLEAGEERFPEIVALYNWTLNYEAGKGPFSLFADLIGWSEENIGSPIYDLTNPQLGYLELSYLADALKEYADKGQEAYDFASSIIEAERGE